MKRVLVMIFLTWAIPALADETQQFLEMIPLLTQAYHLSPPQAEDLRRRIPECAKEADADGCFRFLTMRVMTGWGTVPDDQLDPIYRRWIACGPFPRGNDCREPIWKGIEISGMANKAQTQGQELQDQLTINEAIHQRELQDRIDQEWARRHPQ